MERSSSAPPVRKGSQTLVNPLHSERVQVEYVLEAQRPRELPEQSPGSDMQPLRDYGRIGKGRGGHVSGRVACFVTPPSTRTPGCDGEEPVFVPKQTEGRMPAETKRKINSEGQMEKREVNATVSSSSDDSLQRALEVEVVQHLRDQNALLMAELERLRSVKSSPNSGDGSMQSWVEIPGGSMREGRDGDGLGGRGCGTPRTGIDAGRTCRHTPNGTRVPEGTPPTDEKPEPPPPQHVPPVPPFPTVLTEDPMKMLDNYESMHESSTMSSMRVVDREWKPGVLRSKEPTPSEARNFWLEKEVESLKTALASISHGNPFHKSEYWNGKYENSQVGGVQAKPAPPGSLTAAYAGLCDRDRAEAISRANPGDLPRSLHVLGDESHQDRALHRSHTECHDSRAQQSMALGSHPECPDNRALQSAPGVYHDDRALHSSSHGVLRDGRALHEHSSHGVSRDDRALHSDLGHAPAAIGLLHRLYIMKIHDASAMTRGMVLVGVLRWIGADSIIMGIWGGSSGTKADLPELPALASPLQFGDWIHLCGPVMRDLSSVASRWWDLTVRQAQTHYADWKEATPLQRVQIDPKVPDELHDKCYGRTEQRGVHLLLKAVASELQQTLVTDRQLTSTAILYRLYVRYQPGGPGEKSLILKELTQLPKSNNMAELASSLRSWRRHFGRAREVGAVLPDGTLLLRALEGAVQQVAREDSQAAFRLAQSRSVLRVDELPRMEAVWDFSQCLLAEAETIQLMNTSSSATTSATPLKLKVMEANGGNFNKPRGGEGNSSASNNNGKGKGTSLADTPCKWFRSDGGCRAGRNCKWSHSWDGIDDRNSRCFVCGSKEHRKADCKVRGGGPKTKDETKVSGGGNGPSNVASTLSSSPSTSTVTTPMKPKINEMTTTSTTSTTTPGELKSGDLGGESVERTKDLGDGASDGGRSDRTTEFLQEATQLPKSLKVMNPVMKVMQLDGLDRADENYALVDSGATHGLRPAKDQGEWLAAHVTSVQLASGTTNAFRLKPNTKILLSQPGGQGALIIPMGALNDLDFRVEWNGGTCRIRDDEGRELTVTVVNGCPMISREEGFQLLDWLEGFQQHQRRKLAVIRTLLTAPDEIDKFNMTLEVAFTAKLRQHFPNLPDEVMERVVPYLGMLEAEGMGNKLPWNRRKRRRLAKAKHIIIHCFSGPDQVYWDRQCGSADTEVLCIDTTCSTAANLHDKNVFGYVLMLCASGRVRSVLGGPPCRTLSALRYQGDDGPGVLRNDEFPYGIPSLSAADKELVLGDSVLMFRFWSMFIMAEEVRDLSLPPTQFYMEQPEDPARYRSQQDVQQHGYFSIFRTQEWQDFAERYNLHQCHFDQHPMGHSKRKPTTLATNVPEMRQLDGLRGAPSNEVELNNQFRAMPVDRRCEVSKSWPVWAPGLKLAIATTIQQNVQMLNQEHLTRQRCKEQRAEHASLRPLQDSPEQHQEHFSEQPLQSGHSSVQSPTPEGYPQVGNLMEPSSLPEFGPDSVPSQRTGHSLVQPQEPGSEQPMDFVGPSSLPSLQPDSMRPHEMLESQGRDMTMAAASNISQRRNSRRVKALGPVALEQWRRHFLNDHMPARRDCAHCVRAQARSKPHRRIQHPDAYTLSMDLSGKLSPGGDQLQADVRYLLVGVYTYPMNRNGQSLVPVPGQPTPDEDQPLPGLDADLSEDDMDHEAPADVLLEEDDAAPMDDESPATKRAKSMNETWLKMVEEATDVAVRQLTVVQPVKSRNVKHLLPALARVYSRLRALGLPVYRVHSDRAREFSSAEVQSWATERSILTTMTSGSSFKANGRVEGEMNVIKKSIQTLISSGVAKLNQWPLAARHIGERRLRRQLHQLGWPVGRLLRFGATAFALRKSWQERYAPWREVREEVTILGPDIYSSLTSTGYFVQSKATGRCFFTDDIVVPELPAPNVEEQVLYLPERPEGAPLHRHRKKAGVPALSMLNIEGERVILNRHPDMFEPAADAPYDSSSDSSGWTLETTAASTESSPRAPDFEAEEWWLGVGDVEGVPNRRAGGSHPSTPSVHPAALRALRALHVNLTEYVQDELQCLDATSSDQALWLGSVSEAVHMKKLVEQRLQDLDDQEVAQMHQSLEQQFLVTKTVSNQEVWNDLEAWGPSIHKEFNQLIHNKKAVRQVTKDELRQMARQLGVPIETLPGKMVHVRKPGGVYKSRAVICGNYANDDHENKDHGSSNYAGGVDGQQVRTMVKVGALKGWQLGSTDIATAFLNAPRRETTRLIAMEVPAVFRRLGLAESHHIWVVEKALYGLTSSPRDWAIYRDERIPTMTWKRIRDDRPLTGSFEKTPDENIWRLVEKDDITGEQHWSGLMSIYVDDLLLAAEEGALEAAAKSIEAVWTLSALEKTGEGRVIKYCGFELESAPENDGFIVSQKKYEQEMVQRFHIDKSTDFPNFRITEEDEVSVEDIKPADVKIAQSMAGALLWLTTRTRPDVALSVAIACRLATKNPIKSIEVSTAVMRYVRGVPGGLHYSSKVQENDWGKRGQLKVKRHDRLLEVYADIAYGTGSRHRSLQGLIIYFAGSPVAWASSQRPFVTYSTAESELVSYGEGLTAGRAMLALVCSMMKEPPSAIEKILYGDNSAAISMAHGTGTSSWRTRHLRVRASFLKEALDGVTPDGLWKLLHLRGTELVADGLTKPLHGQAFARFLQDLGMEVQQVLSSSSEHQHASEGGGDSSAAIRALVLGSVLMSTAEGASESKTSDEDSSLLWLAGVALTTLGTIYLGQMLHGATRCCLRRLKRLEEVTSRMESSEEEESVIVISEDEGTSSMRTSSQSGLSLNAVSGRHEEGTTSRNIPSSSGSGKASKGSTSKRSASSLNMPSQSGMHLGSAEHGVRGDPLASVISGEGASATSRSLRTRSGFSSADGAAAAAASSADAAASSSADAAAAALSGNETTAAENFSAQPKGRGIANAWNLFQHQNRGRGLTSSDLAHLYKAKKSAFCIKW
eukprot:s975_g7.t1